MPAAKEQDRAKSGFFSGRNIVITGASSGIGADVALGFAERGAKVALLARRVEVLKDLATKLEVAGGSAIPIACDVTNRGQVFGAIGEAERKLGSVDILVNSAGVLIPGPVAEMPPENLERMLTVNVLGVLHSMQAVLPAMKAAGRGSIVNIASLAGRRGMPPLGGYCATKFAVVGMTEALRVELFGSGVNVSLVMPGVIDTPMVSGGLKTLAGGIENYQKSFAMPARWVTWAVFAAVTLGLSEVDVPLGAATAEKLASLFPGVTGAMLGIGNKLMELTGMLGSKAR
ncbi:MAG TPA: SDR family oxidoreductase [Candidatus Binataceae bacterium]|jgi:NAD(P)-dependent dehydrogenase (short-subunit alcohol dehydrogenase family)